MPGGGTPSKTESVTRTELPAWVDAAGKANYDKAVAMDNQPLEQYGGQRVAPMSQTTQDANSFFKNNMNNGSVDTNEASAIFRKMSDPNAMGAGISGYLNPYIDNVENKALGALDESRVKALMGNADSAIKSRAFGGSRSALVDGVTNAESIKSAGLLSAQIRQQGFDTASAAQRADLTTAGNGLLTSGAQKSADVLKNFGALSQIGSQEQQQSQNLINSDIDKFNEAQQKELNDLNVRLSALGMTPYSSSSATKTTGTSESKGPDWATAGLGILSMLMGLSDDDSKTDKMRIGTDKKTGLGIWAFRYKGDPKTYPKSVGVMASEVEKFMPEAVHKVDGTRIVNYGMLSEVM